MGTSSHAQSDAEMQFREGAFFIIVFLIFYLTVVLRNAWTSDDAYISFRTIDNFVHGYGLTWNVTERVQAYSHPLWVLVLSPVYAVFGNMYFTAIIMSVLFSMAAVAVYAFRIAGDVLVACVGILALTVSDAFVDFSTSGLENPLTYFLMAVFLYLYLRREWSPGKLLLLSLVASLGAVNRHDTLVLYLPMLAYAFWKMRGVRAAKIMVIGFSPFIAWEAFSLIYYGFFLPNPAYAKLGTGLDSSLILRQGVDYLLASFYNDPLTLAIIFAGIALPFALRSKRTIPIAFALALQLVYILKIGGCFMSGRFLAAPVLVAVTVLSYLFVRVSLPKWAVLLPAALILLVGWSTPRSPLHYDKTDSQEIFELGNTINDERCFYNPQTGLMNYDSHADLWPNHGWAYEGKQLRESGDKFAIRGVMGMFGFYAGPGPYIMDVHGLTDPFLARLPLYKKTRYKIGHYRRLFPAGYIKSVKTGTNVITDTSLAKLYDKLVVVTQGNILSPRRFWEILKFNLGLYNDLAVHYNEERLIPVDLAVINERVPEGTSWLDPRNVIFDDSGVQVLLHDIRHDSSFELGRDHNDILRVRYYLDGREIGTNLVPLDPREIGGIESSVVEVPSEVRESGYDELRIFPEEGDHCYSISHVLFGEDSLTHL